MSLLNIIKKNPELRALLGERELKIVEKQILGISLKPSEQTRLSRDIKKKFKAISLLSRFSSEEELKKGAEIKRIIAEAKESILESRYALKIKKIILFGSTMENKRNFSSDIDLAVEFDSISLKEATEFRIKESAKLNNLVDLQVYNILPDKIKKEIEKNCKVIYEQPN